MKSNAKKQCIAKIMDLYMIHPQKINMESKNEGLEDDFPF